MSKLGTMAAEGYKCKRVIIGDGFSCAGYIDNTHFKAQNNKLYNITLLNLKKLCFYGLVYWNCLCQFPRVAKINALN